MHLGNRYRCVKLVSLVARKRPTIVDAFFVYIDFQPLKHIPVQFNSLTVTTNIITKNIIQYFISVNGDNLELKFILHENKKNESYLFENYF